MSSKSAREKDYEELEKLMHQIEPAKNEEIARQAVNIAHRWLMKADNQAKQLNALQNQLASMRQEKWYEQDAKNILCKDCAYVRIHGDSYRTHMYYCTQTDCDTKLDGYCFRARRKGEQDE